MGTSCSSKFLTELVDAITHNRTIFKNYLRGQGKMIIGIPKEIKTDEKRV
ncbi:MAG: hypothetical protein CM1200mP8_5730 [Chloroflexota bacterium]|nr:MAG: hypothetical protein CM1200mP8_5730 [Chloroflexota bacterium]